jgi:L-serine dehydratase
VKFRSVFDIIGPVMLGPSSSHTAGAVRIGQIARKLFGQEPDRLTIHFYGSFAKTYKGHATDVAVVGGLLNMEVADEALPNSIHIAQERGISVRFIAEEEIPDHPNTVKILMEKGSDSLEATGISVGGGAVQITEYAGFPIRLSGDFPTLLILHHDAYGAISQVSQLLEKHEINIAHMEVSRLAKGEVALMLIETDEMISPSILQDIGRSKHVIRASMLALDEI